MPLGTEIGLSTGHIVLDGDPALPRKGAHQPPGTFRCLQTQVEFVCNADATLYGGRPQPSLHCVRWGRSSPRMGTAALEYCSWFMAINCGPCLLWRNSRPSQQLLSSCFVCVWNISGTTERICTKFTYKTCWVPRSDELEGKGQGHQRQKTTFLALSAACVQFMFVKTSLASS